VVAVQVVRRVREVALLEMLILAVGVVVLKMMVGQTSVVLQAAPA